MPRFRRLGWPLAFIGLVVAAAPALAEVLVMPRPLVEFARANRCEQVSAGELSCPPRVEWHNYPGGLSIVAVRKHKLDGFVDLRSPNRKLPRGATATGRMIVISKDGVSHYLYSFRDGG